MKVERNTLAWVANMEVGWLEEQHGAKSIEAAVQDEWTGMEEKKNSELAIDR